MIGGAVVTAKVVAATVVVAKVVLVVADGLVSALLAAVDVGREQEQHAISIANIVQVLKILMFIFFKFISSGFIRQCGNGKAIMIIIFVFLKPVKILIIAFRGSLHYTFRITKLFW
jgi:hypothetical protein